MPGSWGGDNLAPYAVVVKNGSGVNESGLSLEFSWADGSRGDAVVFMIEMANGTRAPEDCRSDDPVSGPGLSHRILDTGTTSQLSYRICAINSSDAEIASVTGTVEMASTKFVFNTEATGADNEVKLYLTNPDVVIDWGDSLLRLLIPTHLVATCLSEAKLKNSFLQLY